MDRLVLHHLPEIRQHGGRQLLGGRDHVEQPIDVAARPIRRLQAQRERPAPESVRAAWRRPPPTGSPRWRCLRFPPACRARPSGRWRCGRRAAAPPRAPSDRPMSGCGSAAEFIIASATSPMPACTLARKAANCSSTCGSGEDEAGSGAFSVSCEWVPASFPLRPSPRFSCLSPAMNGLPSRAALAANGRLRAKASSLVSPAVLHNFGQAGIRLLVRRAPSSFASPAERRSARIAAPPTCATMSAWPRAALSPMPVRRGLFLQDRPGPVALSARGLA
jgi:hypothetical protein